MPSGLAQLTWGVAGAGGDGLWNINPTNKSWFNGVTQQAWPALGQQARFAGTAGNVTLGYAVNASSLTFETSGYVLTAADTAAYLYTTASQLVIGGPGDATIDVGSIVGVGSTLVKSGSGRLTLPSGLVNFTGVEIAGGELQVQGTLVNTPAMTYVLGDVAGAVLTFESETTAAAIGALSGGGATGGRVRPGVAMPLTLSLAGAVDTVFGGHLEDNASSLLFLVKMGSANQTLTGENTYSGTTVISGGTLTLAGEGRALNTAITLGEGATLHLDNRATLVGDRLGDGKALVLAGGTLRYSGHDHAPSSETIGTVTLAAGRSTLEVVAGEAESALLSLASLTRIAAGTVVEVTAGGVVQLVTGANVNGILGGYAVIENDWVTLDATKKLIPFASYTGSLSSGGSADNVRLTAGQTLAAATTTRNSLVLDTSSAGFTLDLGSASNTLRLTSGGLLVTGEHGAQITGGRLTSLDTLRDLIVTTRADLEISSAIVSTAPGVLNLTKSGVGALTLSGANTFAGRAYVLQGTLTAAGGAALADETVIDVSAGATFRLGAASEVVGGLTGNGAVQLQGGQLTLANGNLSGSLAVDLGGGRLVVGAGSSAFAGVISGTGGLTKSGSGTLTLSAAQTFSGAVTIEEGSLLLEAADPDVLAFASGIELRDGAFGVSAGTLAFSSQALPALMSSGDSLLQFHSSTTLGSALSFAASAGQVWSGRLYVTNYTTSLDSLRFGADISGLTTEQVQSIYFLTEFGYVNAQIGPAGFVTPAAIPEPSTYALLAGLSGGVLALWRRRNVPRD